VAKGVNPIGVRLVVCPVDGNGDGYLDTTGGVGIRSPSKKESSGGPLNGRWTWGNPYILNYNVMLVYNNFVIKNY
jgi:hypothetical protein